MRIAMAQLDLTTGDIGHNLRKVMEAVGRAAESGAHLLVLPGMALSGPEPRDLARDGRFMREHGQALEAVQAASERVPLVMGHLAQGQDGRPREAVSLMAAGRTVGQPACPAGSTAVRELDGRRIALTAGGAEPPHAIEDPPSGTDLMVALAARPYCHRRPPLEQAWATPAVVPTAVLNQVGGYGTAVFAGSSFVRDASGQRIAAAEAFAEDFVVADLQTGTGALPEEEPDQMSRLYSALRLGLADYARKCGFSEAVFGLSGGIDSALVACIAADALGAPNVTALGMPSRYSRDLSRRAAAVVADNLGIHYHVISIEELRQSFEKALRPLFAGGEPGVAEQNVQARIRSVLVMAYANKWRALPLATGNRSELAVGYFTLYGDATGGLAPIGDIPKTVVYELARHVNRDRELIPTHMLKAAPSAELAPGQADQDDLPPYEVLDAILELLQEGLDTDQIVERGYDPRVVAEVVARVRWSDFKRRQAPPALRVYSAAGHWPDLPLGARLRAPAPARAESIRADERSAGPDSGGERAR
jgi:NAD+ synthetase